MLETPQSISYPEVLWRTNNEDLYLRSNFKRRSHFQFATCTVFNELYDNDMPNEQVIYLKSRLNRYTTVEHARE